MTPSETFVTLPVIRMSAACNNLVIFAVVSNPKPDDVISVFNRHRTIMDTDARRPVAANFFETERRMTRVGFEQFKIFAGQPLDFLRQPRVELPKLCARAVRHNSLQRPARKSPSASSASASSRPAWTSFSNCLSQVSASRLPEEIQRLAGENLDWKNVV